MFCSYDGLLLGTQGFPVTDTGRGALRVAGTATEQGCQNERCDDLRHQVVSFEYLSSSLFPSAPCAIEPAPSTPINGPRADRSKSTTVLPSPERISADRAPAADVQS